jgi:hypothetical protein
MNVAEDNKAHVTWLERPVDGIVILVVVRREDHVITHAKVTVAHLPREQIGYSSFSEHR